MSAALPTAEACCLPACTDVVVQNIPGPTGADGTNGTNGTDGVSAITTLTAQFTMPAELDSAQATVGTTAGMVLGEPVFVQSLGVLEVTSIDSSVLVTLTNLEDSVTFAYLGNAASGTIAAIGSRVGPTGFQGDSGLLSGAAAGGQLKGTYPNPKLLIPNALGALAVGNGTDATSLSAGTNGQIPAYDSTQPLGMLPKSIIPVTGDTDVAADRLVRLSSATGTPIALESSKASLKDPGGAGVVIADASTGNARGTDAVDLQVSRAVVGASAVASGSRSVIGGGADNTASGSQSVVSGGSQNTNSGTDGFIGGGLTNTNEGVQSAVVGGDTNSITGTAPESFIGGGKSNRIIGVTHSVIAGGSANTVSAEKASILGGASNIVSGKYASIIGGANASADKQGQRAFSSGAFSTQADCQQSDLIWRVSTTDATAGVEAFLDGAGASARATIPTGTTWAFDLLCVGRSSAGVAAAWTVKGAIQNNAGTTALVAAVTNALLADGTGGTWGLVGNAPVASADNANDSLKIAVTGAVATNIRWAIHGRIIEINY